MPGLVPWSHTGASSLQVTSPRQVAAGSAWVGAQVLVSVSQVDPSGHSPSGPHVEDTTHWPEFVSQKLPAGQSLFASHGAGMQVPRSSSQICPSTHSSSAVHAVESTQAPELSSQNWPVAQSASAAHSPTLSPGTQEDRLS